MLHVQLHSVIRCIAAALLIAIGATNPVAAKTIFPAYGGSGDATFDDRCPAHQFLIGLTGRGGLWINQIGIICSPILANGTHGPKYYGPLHGGGGGTEIEFSCPSDSVVYAARVHLSGFNHPKVAQVDLSCGSMQADRQSGVQFGAMESRYVEPPRDGRCPPGELGFGLNGHYGRDVNALGIDCDVLTRS